MARIFCGVTVIIPCFNAAETLPAAFDSVLQQSRLPAEVVVVDDASRDSTWAVIQGLQVPDGMQLIRIRHQNNQGVASARNSGWSCASQPWVAFLDADDYWLPRKLDVQMSWMEQHPEVALTAHKQVMSEQVLAQEPALGPGCQWQVLSSRRQLLVNQVVTSSVVMKRDLQWRFREGKRFSEDYLLWSQVLLSGCQARVCLQPLVVRKPPGSGLSSQLWLMLLGEWDSYAVLHQQGLLRSRVGLYLLWGWSGLKGVRRGLIHAFKLLAAH